MFNLHPQLKKDTFFVTDLTLCRVLLMNDSQFPWLILVPRVNDIHEIYDLDDEHILMLNRESLFVSKSLMDQFQGNKLNVAALGNVVPQLHIHHIVRFKQDVAWPAPVWGAQAPLAYDEHSKEQRIQMLRKRLDKP